MSETRNLIYKLSHLPCSIIIVGLGSLDFRSMNELDGDNGRLTNCMGQKCPRDIVQFIIYEEAMRDGNLNEEVLREIPNQMVMYMEIQGIKPNDTWPPQD